MLLRFLPVLCSPSISLYYPRLPAWNAYWLATVSTTVVFETLFSQVCPLQTAPATFLMIYTRIKQPETSYHLTF